MPTKCKNLRNEKTSNGPKRICQPNFIQRFYIFAMCVSTLWEILALWFLKLSHDVLALWHHQTLLANATDGAAPHPIPLSLRFPSCNARPCLAPESDSVFREQHAGQLLAARGTNTLGMEIGVEFWSWGRIGQRTERWCFVPMQQHIRSSGTTNVLKAHQRKFLTGPNTFNLAHTAMPIHFCLASSSLKRRRAVRHGRLSCRTAAPCRSSRGEGLGIFRCEVRQGGCPTLPYCWVRH